MYSSPEFAAIKTTFILAQSVVVEGSTSLNPVL